MTDITGGCRCGAVRYTLALDGLPRTYACHCHLCQRWSGSAFSPQVLVPETAVTMSGPSVMFEIRTGDRVSTQHACSVCHARLYNINTRRPGLPVVRAGTLDRSEELNCVAHIFTAYRQRWFDIPDDVANWPQEPDLATFGPLMMGLEI
jgi:hypothetical protein